MDNLAGMHPRWLVRPLVWLADKMSGPLFIVEFVLFLLVWMAFNTFGPWRFDSYPYMALNLVMSALAGVQAAVIGVKQTISEYRRTQADTAHQAKYDRIIEHIEQMEEARIAEDKRREDLQCRIVEYLVQLARKGEIDERS